MRALVYVLATLLGGIALGVLGNWAWARIQAGPRSRAVEAAIVAVALAVAATTSALAYRAQGEPGEGKGAGGSRATLGVELDPFPVPCDGRERSIGRVVGALPGERVTFMSTTEETFPPANADHRGEVALTWECDPGEARAWTAEALSASGLGVTFTMAVTDSGASETSALSIQLIENPVRCTGQSREIGTVRGATPGARVTIAADDRSRDVVADDEGIAKLVWACNPEDVGERWTMTVSSARTLPSEVALSAGPSSPPEAAEATVSRGASAQGQPGCSHPSCGYVVVDTTAFGPGTHEVSCFLGGELFFTYFTAETRSSVCYVGWPGRQVWAVVDGVRSNVITW